MSEQLTIDKPHPFWTEERTKRLKDMWADGASAGKIAAALSTHEERITRNGVLGKIHRMIAQQLMLRRETPQPKLVLERRKHPPQPKKIDVTPTKKVIPRQEQPFVEPPVEPPRTPPCSFWELTSNSCRWPFGTETPLKYCGAKTLRGEPYCAHHFRKARPE